MNDLYQIQQALFVQDYLQIGKVTTSKKVNREKRVKKKKID
jgi:hypothetical protein